MSDEERVVDEVDSQEAESNEMPAWWSAMINDEGEEQEHYIPDDTGGEQVDAKKDDGKSILESLLKSQKQIMERLEGMENRTKETEARKAALESISNAIVPIQTRLAKTGKYKGKTKEIADDLIRRWAKEAVHNSEMRELMNDPKLVRRVMLLAEDESNEMSEAMHIDGEMHHSSSGGDSGIAPDSLPDEGFGSMSKEDRAELRRLDPNMTPSKLKKIAEENAKLRRAM